MDEKHIRAEWTKALERTTRERMLSLIGEQSAEREAAERRAAEWLRSGATGEAARETARAMLHADLRAMTVRAYYG